MPGQWLLTSGRRSPGSAQPVVQPSRAHFLALAAELRERARGRIGGRKPKLNARQAATVRSMYEATGPDGKRQHTVAEIAGAASMHRTTVYDYLSKEG